MNEYWWANQWTVTDLITTITWLTYLQKKRIKQTSRNILINNDHLRARQINIYIAKIIHFTLQLKPVDLVSSKKFVQTIQINCLLKFFEQNDRNFLMRHRNDQSIRSATFAVTYCANGTVWFIVHIYEKKIRRGNNAFILHYFMFRWHERPYGDEDIFYFLMEVRIAGRNGPIKLHRCTIYNIINHSPS